MNRNEPQPRRALGKGVGALLPTRPPTTHSAVPAGPSETPYTVAVDAIDANPLQPRRVFEQTRLEELAQSIRQNGIVQPLVVRRASPPDDGGTGPATATVTIRYQLVAGERRLRAARMAGLTEVPVVVREVSDRQLLQVTLIENIQREDLNPIETAQAFQRLAADLGFSTEEIAAQTGKDRSTVVNFIRLLQLPEDLQQLLTEHRLSAGHGRCLLRFDDPQTARDFARKAIDNGWSVRQLEAATKRHEDAPLNALLEETTADPNVKAAVSEMERVLGTKVKIVGEKRGRIEIQFYSPEDLQRIYAAIVGEQ